jgi:hypothetical protein
VCSPSQGEERSAGVGLPSIAWRQAAPSRTPVTGIGNAPNLMIYAIAVERGIAVPNFFGFMAWSAVILVPIFVLVSWLFFA